MTRKKGKGTNVSQNHITDEMIESYRQDGYVIAPKLIPQEDLDRLNERLEGIIDGSIPPADDMVVMRDVMVAKGLVKPKSQSEAIAKIQFYHNDPVLDSYTTHEQILDCVERLIGHDVQTIHTMLINKPPNVQGHHPLHQDLLYFPFRPPEKIVASWTALEPVTRENGCLVAVPGSHKGELLPHGNPPGLEWLNGGYWGVLDLGDAKDRRVHLEMDPGDTVFFHPVLLHGSGRNKTQGFRRAMSAHYCAVDVEWVWKSGEIFGDRKFRIVRGERAGTLWEGERGGGDIDPLEFLDIGQVTKGP